MTNHNMQLQHICVIQGKLQQDRNDRPNVNDTGNGESSSQAFLVKGCSPKKNGFSSNFVNDIFFKSNHIWQKISNLPNLGKYCLQI